MDIYELDSNEAIILQSSCVQRNGYDESEFEGEELHEIVLTNKNIIYVVAYDDALEKESELEVVKVPISEIKAIDGNAQVKQMKHEIYGNCLQIQFKQGIEYWQFSGRGKKDTPRWIEKINDVVLHRAGEQPIPNAEVDNIASVWSSDCSKAGQSCFCTTCGIVLSSTAKFCSECGNPINTPINVANKKQISEAIASAKYNDVASQTTTSANLTYDGKLHKCRNCGEVLNSFELVCPTCGYELRDIDASFSIRAFAEKMEQLQQKGKRADKDNIISYIRIFPIPNTKEDLFEFIILAGANIREDRYDDELPKYKQEISDAWKSKFEQAYEKAKISYGESNDFRKVQEYYNRKIKNIQKEKNQSKINNILIICAVIFLGIIMLVAVIRYSAHQDANHEEQIRFENERLEAIVAEVYAAIDNKNYSMARAKAAALTFSGPNTDNAKIAQDKWNITRQQLLDIIDKTEYGTDYIPSLQEIRIGVTQENLIGENYLDIKNRLAGLGFTNIQIEPVDSIWMNWWPIAGNIEKVLVNNRDSFAANDTYPSDVEIIIFYYEGKD